MTLNEVLESGAVRVPWPLSMDGKLISSSDMSPPQFCAHHCSKHECQDGGGTTLGKVCGNGLTYYQGRVADSTIVVYGVIGSGGRNNVSPNITKRFKDDLKGRLVDAQAFHAWFVKIKGFWGALEAGRERLISEALHPLHETPKIAEEIRNAAESLIQSRGGRDFDEKFMAASSTERSLYKAAELLVDSFDLLAIFFNPASARLGRIKAIEPYKLIDKLSRVLAISKFGGSRKKIRLEGATYRRYSVYESFRVIPLALINNAVKYSLKGEVLIGFDDRQHGTLISITSTGPAIYEEEREYIFQRGARGKHGISADRDGMGVGLFVASKAAEANGSVIKVDSRPLNIALNGIPLAENIFSFIVRDVPRSKGKVN